MSQNYTSKDHFPTWYKTAELSLTEEILKKRLSGIQALFEIDDVEFWLDIVRLAYGIDVKNTNNRDSFVESFREADLTFPIQSNDNIVKVLAEISLCFLFETDSSLGYKVGLAISNANFFEQYTLTAVPFYQMAHNYLMKNKVSNQYDMDDVESSLQLKEEAFDEDEEEEEGLEYEDTYNLVKAVNYLTNENKKLKEESNILWWLFGQYSSTNSAYFNEIALPKMILSASYELLSISTQTGYLPSAKHLIHKVLIICNGNKPKLKDYSLFDSIAATSQNIKEELLKLRHQEELTPFLYALHLEKTLEDPVHWKAAYNKKLGKGLIEKSVKAEELAFQFYSEISFIKSL